VRATLRDMPIDMTLNKRHLPDADVKFRRHVTMRARLGRIGAAGLTRGSIFSALSLGKGLGSNSNPKSSHEGAPSVNLPSV